jgi:very-short-patch-repair endonuclease
VIELDGGQHYSPEVREKDGARDEYMKSVGLTVLRFSDRDVFENINGIIETIWKHL